MFPRPEEEKKKQGCAKRIHQKFTSGCSGGFNGGCSGWARRGIHGEADHAEIGPLVRVPSRSK